MRRVPEATPTFGVRVTVGTLGRVLHETDVGPVGSAAASGGVLRQGKRHPALTLPVGVTVVT